MLQGIDGETVLDLAAGTGKLTALLAERYARVVAVEPSTEMRAVLARNVPSARLLAGSAEDIPLGDESVDAVFVADAFHWFDSRAAAAEIERVLRPGGALVISFSEWTNGFDPGLADEARETLRGVYGQLPAPGAAKVASGEWRAGLTAFEPFEELTLDHEWLTDAEGVASYYVSTSSMGALEPAARAALRDRLLESIPRTTHRLRLTARVFRGSLQI
jgi:SAM-dependent methyltransferase